jgi:transposase
MAPEGVKGMPVPLSMDLRKRIIKARERGDPIAKIAREKEVSVGAIDKLLALHRKTGSYAPRPLNNGRKPKITPGQIEAVRQRITDQPDITLAELIDELHLPISDSRLCKIINNTLGLRRKKNSTRRRTTPPGRPASTRQVAGIPG